MKNAIEIPIEMLGKDNLPDLLREIPDPPARLFIRGKLPDPKNKFLCVVGSRKNSRYGKDACESLIAGLRGYDIVIVSGLALGIDSIAHEAALTAGLQTVALPGSGLAWGNIYPSTNRHLAERILTASDNGGTSGALISEFENYFRAAPYSFPRRNRIMAGMSHAVLVVEAELRSGTLITSRLATEYNRDVLAVPGSIFSSKSEGPHLLLALGATPVRNSDDILAALGFVLPSSESVNTDGSRGAVNAQRTYKNCSPDERKILAILEVPMSRTELITESEMDPTTAIITLSLLELKGLIYENMGEVRLK